MYMSELIPGLKRYKLLQEIARSGLDTPLLRGFRYAKIRGETLFFVFGHPSMKMEFKFKKEVVLGRLRESFRAKLLELKEQHITFKKIEAVVIAQQKRLDTSEKSLEFSERATGAFEVSVSDERVRGVMLEIREIIKRRASGSNR